MGARGPKPLPDNVKAFTGTARRPMRAADLADGVHPEVGLPSMPAHLSAEARKEWKRITPLLLELNLLTKIDRSVRGLGQVVPSSKLQVVSNLEGGVVEEILVKPGQTVKKGDIIVRLSPTQTGAAFGSSTAEVSALEAKM